MNKYKSTNRELWNGWTKINQNSKLYRLDKFKQGENVLKSIELDEIGDVSGKSILHLQCHFGMDTLSWARLGADVTGVDFSEDAIELARSLSNELNIPAQFICSDIYELPKHLDDNFDIVFTSYGVLSWLDDLNKWAELIAHFLKPGGIFYIVEFHPTVFTLDDDYNKIVYPYFHSDEPMKFTDQGNYADPKANFTHEMYEWAHSLGEVVTSLIEAGLQIEFLHEFPFSPTSGLPGFVEDQPARYVIPRYKNMMPLIFSIKAKRNNR